MRFVSVGVAALPALLCGCSFAVGTGADSKSLVLGYVEQNADRQFSRRVTPGLDVRAGGPWQGLNLGWSDIAVVGPTRKKAQRAGDAVSEFVPPLGWSCSKPDGTRRWYGWVAIETPEPDEDVVFVRALSIGAAVGWARMNRGLSIGLSAGTVLEVSPEVEGTFALMCTSPHAASCWLKEWKGGSDE